MRAGASALMGVLTCLATPARAETTTSTGPETVAISVYRAPERGVDDAMELSDLQGYALITETRRIAIPGGDGMIRFEGVAGGILPESAIVTGLPEGVIEKNQDANLLSPASLLGAATGRRVTIRRTDRRTGVARAENAIIRSGPDGAVVLQTAAGLEALQCTGIPETMIYDGVPGELSAKPTLSVRTHSARPAVAMVTLSYLADNFDWQANYVLTIADDGAHFDLFGWVTLASADETSFVNADAATIAGHVNREGDDGERPEPSEPSITLHCWPQGTTSDIGMQELPRPEPEAAPMMAAGFAGDIIVTAQRRDKMMQNSPTAVTAIQEDLGDLKLYRVPVPVTVAANAQKQVALLDKPHVPVTIVYRSTISGGDASPAVITLRAHNKPGEGLGLPLPQGRVAIYQSAGDRPLLLGEASLADKAVGEDIEIDAATTTNVTVALGDASDTARRPTLTIANANPRAIRFEAKFVPEDGETLSGFNGKVRRKDGAWLWEVTVPANGTAVLGYRRKTTG